MAHASPEQYDTVLHFFMHIYPHLLHALFLSKRIRPCWFCLENLVNIDLNNAGYTSTHHAHDGVGKHAGIITLLSNRFVSCFYVVKRYDKTHTRHFFLVLLLSTVGQIISARS